MNTNEWWRTAVAYQIYVRSFADGNGDGIGDLAGITSRLVYLQQMGVDAIWLTPCYPSPQADHGYDVADYFAIEPAYGTLDEFDTMVDTATSLGIRVLMDIVPNHLSEQHSLFTAAVAAGPQSAARDLFYFRDGRGPDQSQPPNDWLSVFGGSAWTRLVADDGTPEQWYLHTFTSQQPDVNWSNPAIGNYFDDVLRFWFDRGVEGFRIDAVTVAGKEPGLPDAGLPSPDIATPQDWHDNPHTVFHPSAHDVWRRWRRLIDSYQATHPGRQLVTVSEAYTADRPELLAEYLGGDQFHQSFAFDLMLATWRADIYRPIIEATIASLADVGATPTWTMNNHDTQRIVTRLGRANATDADAHTGNNLVYVDAAVDLALGHQRARAACAIVAALPGCMYLYQGEELGLPEVLDLPDAARQDPIFFRTAGKEIGRDGCRVPLPWAATPEDSFGFSGGVPTTPWLPQPAEWAKLAADQQAADPQSMLWWYRTVLSNRRHVSAALVWLDTASIDPDLMAFVRDETMVVANFGTEAVTLPADLVGERRVVLSSSVTQHSARVVPANACIWLRLSR